MQRFAWFGWVPALLVASGAFISSANARTQPVTLDVLNASVTLQTPFLSGDTLRLDTLVTNEVGALLQSITFTVGAGVGSFLGEAAWEVSTAAGTAPRLVGVNIDLFNATNTIVATDSFLGVLGGFAVSALGGAISPGTYKLLATGTGVRDSSLDLTLSFAGPVPEPGSYALILAGLAIVGLIARRRR